MQDLVSLELSGNQINDIGVKKLTQGSFDPERLTLDKVLLGDEGVEHLKHFKNLS